MKAIIETVKKRAREHDVSYEGKLLKERSKDDFFYEDKEKFITSAYMQRLVEREKWLEEERLRGLSEEKDDVRCTASFLLLLFSCNSDYYILATSFCCFFFAFHSVI